MFKPKYTISSRIVNRLSEIAEIKATVARSALLPEREVFLRRAATIKMAHTSTSIEGNRLQEYQVEELAQGKKIQAERNQIKEVENYLLALKQIDKLSELETIFKEADIFKVHKTVIDELVPSEKAGVWRKNQVYIVNISTKGEEEVAYTPPTSADVPILVKELINWLDTNREVHPIIRAGLFHYQFETIHPFTDGNGRTGRLLTLLHLYQSGWDFKKTLVLEDFYNNNRKRYYESLQTGKTYKLREEADLTGWLEYFVEGFLEEARKVKDQIVSLSVLGDLHSTRNILDKDELMIVDFAVSMGKVTSLDVVDFLRIPQRTAQSKLKKLEDIKVLKKLGAGPASYYVISDKTK